jgi:hypothetical protein
MRPNVLHALKENRSFLKTPFTANGARRLETLPGGEEGMSKLLSPPPSSSETGHLIAQRVGHVILLITTDLVAFNHSLLQSLLTFLEANCQKSVPFTG